MVINQLLGNDLVINEDSCNLSCEYCLTGQSNLKTSHAKQLIFDPPRRATYDSSSELGKNLPLIVDRVKSDFHAPLLKITGGEIFLVRGMLEFLREQAAQHEILVVQTNGVLLKDEDLAELETCGNVVVQVSLDSHTFEGNSYRVATESLHRKVLAKVDALLRSALPVEVYCVVNNRSVSHLSGFAQWLASFDHPPTMWPFPVRGPGSGRYAIRSGQIRYIEDLVAGRARYEAVMPPSAYFDRLLDFYRDGKRTLRCHLPRLVISTFSDGVVTPCPNIWFSDLGNLISDGHQEVLKQVGQTGLYQALLALRPRLDACKGCFTPWDMLSMYFEDEITIEMLAAVPTYSPPSIRKLIEEEKRKYLAERENEHLQHRGR